MFGRQWTTCEFWDPNVFKDSPIGPADDNTANGQAGGHGDAKGNSTALILCNSLAKQQGSSSSEPDRLLSFFSHWSLLLLTSSILVLSLATLTSTVVLIRHWQLYYCSSIDSKAWRNPPARAVSTTHFAYGIYYAPALRRTTRRKSFSVSIQAVDDAVGHSCRG